MYPSQLMSNYISPMPSDHTKIIIFTETLVTLSQDSFDCFEKKYCISLNLLEIFFAILRKFCSNNFLITKKNIKKQNNFLV